MFDDVVKEERISQMDHIFKIILEGVRNTKHPTEVSFTRPDRSTLDPDRFNRGSFTFGTVGGHTYTISVFAPAHVPTEGDNPVDRPLELTEELPTPEEEPSPQYTCPPVFSRDHRDNQNLHRLYVRYAIQELLEIYSFIETMHSYSRVSASIIAGELRKIAEKEVMDDAAWFEAAALIRAGVDLKPYLNDPINVFDGMVITGDSLKGLEPGTYNVKIDFKDGQAVMELADGQA